MFLEAIFIHGLFPYVAILLLAGGEVRASIAGLVIAAFGVGGVVYSVLGSGRWSPRRGATADDRRRHAGRRPRSSWLRCISPGTRRSPVFAVLGFGFYLLHGSIQVHVTELSPTARGAAASLHSCFFYLGQATGPVVYGFGFAHGEPWSRACSSARRW